MGPRMLELFVILLIAIASALVLVKILRSNKPDEVLDTPTKSPRSRYDSMGEIPYTRDDYEESRQRHSPRNKPKNQ